jgi:hypothetical protein
MVTAETIGRVRHAFHIRGKGIKQIARELRLARNTVRIIVRGDETKHTYERKTQPLPKLGLSPMSLIAAGGQSDVPKPVFGLECLLAITPPWFDFCLVAYSNGSALSRGALTELGKGRLRARSNAIWIPEFRTPRRLHRCGGRPRLP